MMSGIVGTPQALAMKFRFPGPRLDAAAGCGN